MTQLSLAKHTQPASITHIKVNLGLFCITKCNFFFLPEPSFVLSFYDLCPYLHFDRCI